MLVQSPNLDDIHISWRTRIATAGSPPPAAIIQQVQTLVNMEVIHMYGSTEVSPFLSICEWRHEFAQLEESAQAPLKACQGVEMVFSGETSVLREMVQMRWRVTCINIPLSRNRTTGGERYLLHSLC